MVTIAFNAEMSEERFMNEINDPVRKKFPNVRLVYRPQTLVTKEGGIQVSGSEIADLQLVNTWILGVLNQHHCLADLSEYEKELGLSQIEPHLLAWGWSEHNQLFVPYNNTMEFPFMYNKRIFDQADVEYPKDGMSWEEVINLAERVIDKRNDKTQYGLDPADLALMRMQAALSYIDHQTGKANMLHPDWQTIARILKRIYGIPNNILPENMLLRLNRRFARKRSIAMGVVCTSCYLPSDLEFDWDMVSYPVHADGPHWAPNTGCLGIAMSARCSYPEAAAVIISFLVSNEFQKKMSRNGTRSSLTDQDIHDEFGANVSLYQNKNVRAFSRFRPAPLPKQKDESLGSLSRIVRDGFVKMILENLDEEAVLNQINLEIEHQLTNKASHSSTF
jgi:multiple sugar transport system substrate-binding protein